MKISLPTLMDALMHKWKRRLSRGRDELIDNRPFPWDNDNAPFVQKGTSSYERMKEIEARVRK